MFAAKMTSLSRLGEIGLRTELAEQTRTIASMCVVVNRLVEGDRGGGYRQTRTITLRLAQLGVRGRPRVVLVSAWVLVIAGVMMMRRMLVMLSVHMTGSMLVRMCMQAVPVHRWKEHPSQQIPEQGERGTTSLHANGFPKNA